MVIAFVKNNFKKFFLNEKPTPSTTVADLNLSLDIKESLKKIQEYEFTKLEILHYSFLAVIFLIDLLFLPFHFILKIAFLTGFALLILLPITSQFFLNALPIVCWLLLFAITNKIPTKIRPPISVFTLPAIETIFYGDNLSEVLAASTYPFLDILAWLPYGMIHFALPFVLAGLLFLFGPPTCLRSYAFAFGYMNLFGVMIQILFPAAPPWYKLINGLNPANYSMGGSPGGLKRIDELFGIDLYTTTFTNAPVPFGAFPSLHSGCAVMETLFLSYLFPRFAAFFWGYSFYLWWCTMYLTHHYFIDLIAGACLSFAIFTYTKFKFLPILDEDKFCRWSYAEIVKPDIHQMDPLNNYMNLNGNDEEYELENMYYHHPNNDSDDDTSSLVSRNSSSSRLSVPPINTQKKSKFNNKMNEDVLDSPSSITSSSFNALSSN